MQIPRRVGMALATALVCAPGTARADAVLDWTAIMGRTVAGQNPFAQGGTAAVAQFAVFEAVNAITGDYRPVRRRASRRRRTPPPRQRPWPRRTRCSELTCRPRPRRSMRRGHPRWPAFREGPAKAKGLLAGESAAAAVMALRADDGSVPPQFHVPGSTAPGEWQLTPGLPAGRRPPAPLATGQAVRHRTERPVLRGKPCRKLLPGVLVGERGHDDHVVARLPSAGVATECRAVSLQRVDYAQRLLGLTRHQLYIRMKRHGLEA